MYICATRKVRSWYEVLLFLREQLAVELLLKFVRFILCI